MNTPFGLYVHVPFCARACPYCDFDFRVDARPDAASFVSALDVECRTREDVRGGQTPNTIYVGGGTPSVLGPAGLAELLAWIGERWSCEDVREWTVEFNPEHVDEARLAVLVDAGVSRISLGVQSFDAIGLRMLGRAHDVEQAHAAIDAAHTHGLSVSADLIVGWPEQTGEGLKRELEAVLRSGCTHASIYALTIESGTPWERLARRGVRRLPQADASGDRLAQTHDALTAAGFEHYEIASYAKGGAIARHNTGYWRGLDYVGLGPSAASARFDAAGVCRRTNAAGARWWAGDPPNEERLDSEARAREALWLGLRELTGVEITPFLARVDRDEAWLAARIARPLAQGNLERSGPSLRVASGRWLHHDAIAVDLL